MKSIIIIIVYFGKWPEWINLFMETCKWNPSVNWLFISDCAEPENRCNNVKYVRMDIEDLLHLVTTKLGVNFYLHNTYKLCDLRPAYGAIFEDYINGYDYFGWGDIDVVYGDIRKFITDKVLEFDVISFHGNKWLSNHFLILKNSPDLRYIHKSIKEFESKINNPKYQALDDRALSEILFKKKAYLIESFSTPDIPLIPWRDQSFVFPTEWYWNKGKLTNNKDTGIGFLYFHFMTWKGNIHFQGGQWLRLKRIVHFDYRKADLGWKINKKGFFKIENTLYERFFYYAAVYKIKWRTLCQKNVVLRYIVLLFWKTKRIICFDFLREKRHKKSSNAVVP